MIGLNEKQIKQIILNRVNDNPDLRYYLDDDAVNELVDKVIEGFTDAIIANNKAIENMILKCIIR